MSLGEARVVRPYQPYGQDDFRALWETNKRIFFGKCLRLMKGNVSDAEDALSTAMLKAWEKMTCYRARE